MLMRVCNINMPCLPLFLFNFLSWAHLNSLILGYLNYRLKLLNLYPSFVLNFQTFILVWSLWIVVMFTLIWLIIHFFWLCLFFATSRVLPQSQIWISYSKFQRKGTMKLAYSSLCFEKEMFVSLVNTSLSNFVTGPSTPWICNKSITQEVSTWCFHGMK